MLSSDSRVLVTGATGYVGTRLVARLLDAGFRVRAAGRSLEKLRSRPWAEHALVELRSFDVLNEASITEILEGCTAAYYLVHSMNPGTSNFSEIDRQAALFFKDAAAKTQGLKRLIYLGGLGEENPDLSKHLKSRAEVARILQSGPVPVTVLRAAMIIGSGSASFEILRYLVDRLPVMVTPRWVETPNQPIGIENVLTYLVGCLRCEATAGKAYDIGGEDVLAYRDLMRVYAEEAGLPRRIIFPVPVLTPRLSSYWIHFVTPVPASIAKPLAEGLRNAVVCRDFEIRKLIPQKLQTCREAIREALGDLQAASLESHWSDAGKIPPAAWSQEGDPEWAGGAVFKDKRQMKTAVSREVLWPFIRRIGGRNGWYHGDRLWAFRGVLDRLAGGVGLRRGRRDDEFLSAGDALDFWRVVEVKDNERLLLSAEMKLPGYAVLEFKLKTCPDKQTELIQTAFFKPRGLLGVLYWFLVCPLHAYIFEGMLRKIVSSAEKQRPF